MTPFPLLDGPCTFQVIPEGSCRALYTNTLHGYYEELEPALRRFNGAGHGVFVAVNETDGRGRKACNITGVRAFYADIDGLPLRSQKQDKLRALLDLPLPPSAVVQTRNGLQSYHFAAAGTPLESYERVQRGVVKALGGDWQVRDIARILRVPGFYHMKKNPYMVEVVHNSALVYTADELLDAYPAPEAPKPAPYRVVSEPGVWAQVLLGAAEWNAPPQNRHLAMYLLGGVAHKFGVKPEEAAHSLEPIVAHWNIERNWQPELHRTVKDGHARGAATVKALRNLGMPIPPLGRPV